MKNYLPFIDTGLRAVMVVMMLYILLCTQCISCRVQRFGYESQREVDSAYPRSGDSLLRAPN
jgi:hypothetical protein